jgi:hypothetical protein
MLSMWWLISGVFSGIIVGLSVGCGVCMWFV